MGDASHPQEIVDPTRGSNFTTTTPHELTQQHRGAGGLTEALITPSDDAGGGVLSDVFNTSTVRDGIGEHVLNATQNISLDLGNLTSSQNETSITNITSSENSTSSIILQTLKKTLENSTEKLKEKITTEDGMVISQDGSIVWDNDVVGVTTAEPEGGGLTSMQKWFLATGVLIILCIVLLIVNCFLQYKDAMIKEIAQQRHDRRIQQDMARDSTDPTQTHMFMHPFFGKKD